jgi:hypothetical protein
MELMRGLVQGILDGSIECGDPPGGMKWSGQRMAFTGARMHRLRHRGQ